MKEKVSLAAHLFLHRFAKRPIQSRLIARCWALEPSHHVRVQAHRELLFGSAAKGIADDVFQDFSVSR